jgi:hypothetical protein
LRFSELGTAMPFGLDAFDSGDPIADDVCETGGDGLGFWAICVALFVVTEAMVSGVMRFDAAPTKEMQRQGRRGGGGQCP